MNAHTVWLPFPPSANCLFATSSNGRRRFPSRRYKTWRKSAGSILMAARIRPTPGAYHLQIRLRAPDKRARDADNHIKAISDLIVAHALVGDDSMALSVSAEWVSDGLPGAWVTIIKAQNDEAANAAIR